LRLAHTSGRRPVAVGDATALPIAAHSADVVVSMALMLIANLEDALTEIHRILRPGGDLRALVPATSPLTTSDRWHYARLSAAIRSIPRFPPTTMGTAALAAAGFTITTDERRRFTVNLDSPANSDEFVDSWYTPSRPLQERARHVPVLGTIGVPLRRLIARRA
jgi:SAM-dependent methyltransferase